MNELENLTIIIIFLLPCISVALRKELLSYENLHLKSMYCSNIFQNSQYSFRILWLSQCAKELNQGKIQTSL